ncbi:MAG: hypothetical protein PF637_08095 [Spirochaetes bacterium]|jgi:hypothetical protein|nr:hypothetical protein [Spirochaetota bacterium]
MKERSADVLIPYNKERITDNSILISLFVRPESNRVDYEALIAQGMKGIGTPFFMANYNGEVISKRHIVLNHYFLHYLFALHGKEEVLKYPEFSEAFQNKFRISVKDAHVLGSFEYLQSEYNDRFDEESLFHFYANEKDFLLFHGNSIKRINGIFVVNYDIPAILKSYTEKSNILIFSICCCNGHTIDQLNYSLFTKFSEAGILPGKKSPIPWYNQVRRIYHISSNHIEAMFDLTDYTLNSDLSPIRYSETPLGSLLIKKNIFTADEADGILDYFKKYPFTYIAKNQKKTLINLREAGTVKKDNLLFVKNLDECAEIFKQITS